MTLIKRKELFKLSNCWLSPEGEIIVGDDEFDGNSFHEELALCIIRDLKCFQTKMDAFDWIHENFWNKYAYDWLEEQGWIRLHGFRQSDRARWITFQDQKLTFQQKQKIRKWCELNGKTWDEAVQVC